MSHAGPTISTPTFDPLACPLDSYKVIEHPQAGGPRWLVTVNPKDGSHFPICQLTSGEHPFLTLLKERDGHVQVMREVVRHLEGIIQSASGTNVATGRLGGCKGAANEALEKLRARLVRP